MKLIIFFIVPIFIFSMEIADHLLLSRIVITPNSAETISIFNPTGNIINLSNYYLCNDKDYYKIQTENDTVPSGFNNFITRFPNININPNTSLIIALNSNYSSFYVDLLPDLTLFGENENSMLQTGTNSFGLSDNKLDDSNGAVILFKWDGNIENNIEDIDYFKWGGISNAVDKTGIADYHNDTPVLSQLYFEQIALEYYGYSRIEEFEEVDENQSDGNGITGNDETSEDFRQSWEIISIINLGCTNEDSPNYDPYADIDDGSCTVSISSILDGEYNDQYARVEGMIVDYFDITVFNGPHSLTLSDENHNELEISIWSDVMTDTLFMLTDYPMAKYRVSAYGMIDLYPDANNNGICDEPDEDSDCTLPPSLWECDAGLMTGLDEFSGKMSRAVNNHCKWQLQLASASDLTIIDTIAVEYPLVSFSDLLAYSNDVKASPWFHKNITIQGLLVDYVDITESCGPHVMTLEDANHFRLEVITFDASWSNSLSCLTLPPFGAQYIEVKGYVGEYKNEIQISFDNENSVALLDSYSLDGEFYTGQGACFADDGNFLEGDKQFCEDNNFHWVKANSARIIPVSYVLIPSLNERLDFSYISPAGSRTIVRIFDISGRFITSLVDRYDQQEGVVVHNSHKTSWDGRDHLGQIVLPGTYLIHLEAINFSNGETSTDQAPIVVGVK